MAFNQQEQEIIKWGLQNGKSKDEVKQAISNFRLGIVPQKTKVEVEKPSMFERVQTSIQEKGAKVQEQIAGEGEFADKSALERGIGATATGFSALSSTLYNVLPEVARNTLDKAGEAIGGGINYLADKISENPALQRFANSEAGQDTERVARVLADLGIISGEILGADQSAKLLQKGTDIAKKGLETAGEKLTAGTEQVFIAGEKLLPKSPEIMNRVARLNPKQAQTFEKLAGKSHGQYLTETGNFGTPDKIIANEATKFTQSLNSVDDALNKLPGVYKYGSIADALKELSKKAIAESSDNIKSPYFSRVKELTTKFSKEGLNMSEINEVKRLFERNVKLGYNKLTDATKVKQATNIDSALREWQVKQASDLGFKNIADLNKQTQLSKFIINNLGDQVVGKSGLNNVTLTDWIMLSGGDPTAVAGFLTKKFFSSKGVQAKIAEMLNKGDIKGQIKADITSTPESIKRAASPQGLEQLPAPQTGSPKSQVNVPINQPSRKAIEQGTEIVPRTTPSKQTPQPQSKIKSGKAYTKTIPQDETILNDPLYEFKNLKGTFTDGFKGKSEVMEAIKEIGGIKNVKRDLMALEDLKPTEIFSEDNLGVQRALKEIKSGVNIPLIVDEAGNILDGNHRYVAQKMLGKMNIRVIKPKELPTSTVKNQADNLTSSIQKAKASGQSFDEWVKGQATELNYKNLQENDYSIKAFGKDFNEPVEYFRAGQVRKNGDIWLTDNEAGAMQYSSAGGGTKVGKYIVQSKNPLIIDTAGGKYANGNIDINKILTKEEIAQGYTNNPDIKKKFIDYAKNNGYDAVQFADSFPDGEGGMRSLVVWNKDQIKTRSQLKAEWDKVKTKK